MTYSANRDNRKGNISSWFWATAPAGTSITVEADDHFTFYPLRDAETGLPATLSASTTTPGKPPAQYVPAEATGSVISNSRTKYFYSAANDDGPGYFSASGFVEVENFDTSEHFLAVNASAHSGRVCEWLGEMGYAVNTATVPAWLTLSLDTAGASYTVAANTTGAERVADVEFLAYSGQSMAVQIRQLATATPTRSRTEWRPATPPAGTPQVNYKLISYSPNPLHAGYSGYVSFRYSYEKIWTQEEFLIVEKLSADGKTVLSSTATKTATPPRQTKQTFYASGSQHKAGATDPNIGGNALSLYSANGNYVGSAPLTSSGGGGSGGSGGSGGNGGSGGSGGSGTGTGGAGTGTGGIPTSPGVTIPPEGDGFSPGAGGSQNADTHVLTIRPTQAAVPAAAGSACVQLAVDGELNTLNWSEDVKLESIKVSASWLSATNLIPDVNPHAHVPEYAYREIIWQENSNTFERSGVATFTLNTGATATFTIRQAAGVFDEAKSFWLAPGKLTFPAKGGALAVKLHNAELHGGIQWIGISYRSFINSVTRTGKITVSENTTDARRTDTVQFHCADGASAEVEIEQLAPGEKLTEEDIGSGGGSGSSGDSGDGDSGGDDSGNGDGGDDSETGGDDSGAGGDDNSGAEDEAPRLSVSPGNIEASHLAGTAQLSVSANCDWFVEIDDNSGEDEEWIQISQTSGSGNAAPFFSFTENTGTNAREAAILFFYPDPENPDGFPVCAGVRITQDGKPNTSGEAGDGGDSGNTGDGDSGGDSGDAGDTDAGGNGDAGETPGDTETPPPQPRLSVALSRERIGFAAQTLTLTATFSGIAAAEVSLAADAVAEAFVSAALTAETATSKTWTLNVSENRFPRERTAAFSILAGTLAEPAVFTQIGLPRRAAAFYRNKRLWKPTFFFNE